jgi:Flp pilus assembly pilin Flp
MKNLLKRLLSEDRGQDVIEYALLAAALSVVAIPTVPQAGTFLGTVYTFIQGQVNAIPATAP